eukprot:CAMPEP_0198715050 /NCGR_PEP_ID=MMETSP1471-20131121/26835_1 /TAXON_ID=41880 /ORGANISM="Pycnococcus provasolii, Strain RCC733" /LENGTH=83 /DNA_ID=CAMNT_0044475421 /DNA_START=173 /DNA_END=424 /DNA_ORIENTATION=-
MSGSGRSRHAISHNVTATEYISDALDFLVPSKISGGVHFTVMPLPPPVAVDAEEAVLIFAMPKSHSTAFLLASSKRFMLLISP